MYSWKPTNRQQYDLLPSINPPRVKKLLEEQLAVKNALRWYLSVKVRFVKVNTGAEVVTVEPHFTGQCQQLLNAFEIDRELEESIDKIKSDFEAFIRNGSGWVLDKVLKVFVNIGEYRPLKGSSYIPLPKGLIGCCHGIINIKNNDSKCFVWSVLASLHPMVQNAERIHHYRIYEPELNLQGIEMPMSLNKIPKFEKMNNISVNVFGYQGEKYPLYISNQRFDRHVNLLLINQGSIQHFCTIKNLNQFLASENKHKGKTYFCPYCLHGFCKETNLAEHKPNCTPHGPQKIKMPAEDEKYLKFTNIKHQLPCPFIVYADFECLLPKVASFAPNPDHSSTTLVEKHVPCGYCYKVISTNPEYSKPAVVYRGEEPVTHFLKALEREAKDIFHRMSQSHPMKLTKDDEAAFQNAKTCYICQKWLGLDRVRDHDHLKGGYNYRGAAHNSCNLNYKYPIHLPIVLHNARSYDNNIILSQVGKMQPKRVTCIPNNMEKYISFSIGNLRFIDSLQFLNASLSTLVDNLACEGSHKFSSLKQHFPTPTQHELLLRKGIYPYSYMDSEKRFAEQQLPPIEEFYNALTGENLTSEDYSHAEKVWETFNIKNLGEYHDLYLLTDVLLLADVFQNFRSTCQDHYGLDPAHYYTSSGLAWDAMLKKTGVELELLTDPDMHLFIEKGIRGGVSMIGKKYASANNPYVEGYDADKKNVYLSYLDANNLYGWAMVQPLPQRDFKWATDDEIKEFDIENVPESSDRGFILEVDLEYSDSLHDTHSDYPLAPESITVTHDMLSPYSKDLLQSLGRKQGEAKKLVPNLSNKSKYVLHYVNLKQYVSLGMHVTKIHRILSFHQSTWLKPYIEFNTEKRFKLLNNSVFGKTMENLRNHVSVELVCTRERLRKLLAAPNLVAFRIFDENLAAVEQRKTILTLNRPIYVGMAILDLSKTLMYNFYYNHLKKCMETM